MNVTVRVPASTSNLGSGFDTLGLAVNRFLTLEARRADRIELEMGGANRAAAEGLIREALGPLGIGMAIRIQSDIPVGRGLGASAALRVAVLKAASVLAERTISDEELLQRAYALEHHPDNASPAISGGFTVSGVVQGRVQCARFEVDADLKLVTLIPPFELPTGPARELLPSTYSRADAAHSLNRAAMITARLAQGRYRELAGLFDDVLHQPYRRRLIPKLPDVIHAGVKAGAIGGFLSGAGSAIICLALEREEEIARAMQGPMEGRAEILRPVNRGLILL